jgi:hypothetical protein
MPPYCHDEMNSPDKPQELSEATAPPRSSSTDANRVPTSTVASVDYSTQ